MREWKAATHTCTSVCRQLQLALPAFGESVLQTASLATATRRVGGEWSAEHTRCARRARHAATVHRQTALLQEKNNALTLVLNYGLQAGSQ